METFLTFIAGIVAAYVVFMNSERKIAIENITKERALWRETIRGIAGEIEALIRNNDENSLPAQKNRLRLLLNPKDKADNRILDLVACGDKNAADDFSTEVAYLLKHDWERAKLESQSLVRRLICFHKNESATTSSRSRIIKWKYRYFYHPKRYTTAEPTIAESSG